MSETSEQGARDAVEALIRAFGDHDREAYFAAFAPDATFIFHNVPQDLGSLAEWEALFSSWEADGFRVLSCRSEDASLRMLGDDAAVFSHRVTTRLAGEDEVQRERETIVVQRQANGEWLAVHEHLSPLP